jgi:hypothetical protein
MNRGQKVDKVFDTIGNDDSISEILDLMEEIEQETYEKILSLAENEWDSRNDVGDIFGRAAIENLIENIKRIKKV